MINKFPGYYNNDIDKVKKLWEQCFFVLDTNVLLNFIRFPIQYFNFFKEFLNKYSDRVYIPFQIAQEYHKNILLEINKQEKSYEKIVEDIGIDKLSRKLENEYSERHPTIKINEIIDLLKDCNKKISEILSNSKAKHYDPKKLMLEIANLLKNNLGDQFSEADLKKIYKEGEERFKNKIPPGFADAKNKKLDNEIYGDLVIWKSIINFSLEKKVNIIFICDDKKDDWYLKIDNHFQGRPELINEFSEQTGKDISIMTSKYLINLPKEISSIEQDQSSISTINNFNFNNLNIKRYKPLFDPKVEAEIENIKNWFYENFEDPMNGVPYDSEDGEFFYSEGGNADVHEALYEEFENIYSEDLIEQAADEIINESGGLYEWVKKGLY